MSYIVDSNSRFGLSVNLLWMLLSTKASSTRCSSSWTKGAPQINGSIRGSCSLAIAIPVQRHVGHITWIFDKWFMCNQNLYRGSRLGGTRLFSMYKDPITFPEPEQFGHLSVFGADKGWSPSLNVETGSVSTRAPVLEQRAHARYPTRHMNIELSHCLNKQWIQLNIAKKEVLYAKV